MVPSRILLIYYVTMPLSSQSTSKAHSNVLENFGKESFESTFDDETLMGQLDQLERRNNLHKKINQVKDRAKVRFSVTGVKISRNFIFKKIGFGLT